MKTVKILLFVLIAVFVNGCAVKKEPIVIKRESAKQYKYVVIPETSTVSSGSGVVVGSQYGVYGGSKNNEVNPGALIEGIMLKRGLNKIEEVRPDVIEETLIVKYGESGRRNVFLGYALEVTIVLLDAKTNDAVYTCTAEGMGETEADDIRKAIHRCLSDF